MSDLLAVHASDKVRRLKTEGKRNYRTSVIALGGELSLWNPRLLDWLVEMKKTKPEIALRPHVGLAEQ